MPFGSPVEPEVKIEKKLSSLCVSIFWLSDFGSTNEGLNVKPPKAKDEFPLINTLNESFSSLFMNSYVISNCATPSSILHHRHL